MQPISRKSFLILRGKQYHRRGVNQNVIFCGAALFFEDLLRTSAIGSNCFEIFVVHWPAEITKPEIKTDSFLPI